MALTFTRETALSAIALVLFVACAGDDATVPPSQGVGAQPANGGGENPGQGGSENSGTKTGGTSSSLTGGRSNDSSATGGMRTSTTSDSSGTGGSQPTGGRSNTSNPTGGARQTGGTTQQAATGGVRQTGGAPATGGARQTGGAPATGGARQTGGAPATGGTASSSTSNSSCSSAVTGGTCPPKSCPQGASDCGCYTFAGLGARKKQILDAGGDVRFIASAMVETENLKTDYKYGDGKSGDAFNAGCCKQNWFMIRQCHPAWRNLTANDYATSAAMNSDLKLDIQVYNECRAAWSDQKWFAAHRNGQQGFDTGYAPNLELFINAYNWTVTNLQNGHMCDDVRFWATVPAIVVD